MVDRKKKKGRILLPAFCNILGMVLIQIVILVLLPMAIQNYREYSLHNVKNPDMEPSITRSSLIIVRAIEPVDAQPGDIILFVREGETVVSRVVTNRIELEELFVQGDANAERDPDPIPYDHLIGRVTRSFPMLGPVMALMTTQIGKLYMLLLILCGVLLMVLADRLRK